MESVFPKFAPSDSSNLRTRTDKSFPPYLRLALGWLPLICLMHSTVWVPYFLLSHDPYRNLEIALQPNKFCPYRAYPV